MGSEGQGSRGGGSESEGSRGGGESEGSADDLTTLALSLSFLVLVNVVQVLGKISTPSGSMQSPSIVEGKPSCATTPK